MDDGLFNSAKLNGLIKFDEATRKLIDLIQDKRQTLTNLTLFNISCLLVMKLLINKKQFAYISSPF